MTFVYFSPEMSDRFTFYRIPKILITEPAYDQVSTEAKILYGLMLDRQRLSAVNKWVDEKNRVYIFFKVEEVEKLLHVGKKKAIRLLKELEEAELIRRTRQGFNQPSRIYLGEFWVRAGPTGGVCPDNSATGIQMAPSTGAQTTPPEVSESNLQRFPNDTTGGVQTGPQEVSNGHPNKNEKNKTERNKNEMSEKAGSSSRKGYGTYHNVFLSEDELSQLMARFPHDYMDRIENLSLYQKSHGRTYSDHMATILGWALRDKDKQKSGSGGRGKGVPKDYSREHNLTL